MVIEIGKAFKNANDMVDFYERSVIGHRGYIIYIYERY